MLQFRYQITSILLIFSFLCFSCDRPQCDTNNTVFLNYEVTSDEYQTEVAKHIESIGIENLRFWLADYIEKADKHYFIFYTQGHDLCAQTMVCVDENNKSFEDILKTKGKGRFNAEFVGLRFDTLYRKMDMVEFQYTGHESIID